MHDRRRALRKAVCCDSNLNSGTPWLWMAYLTTLQDRPPLKPEDSQSDRPNLPVEGESENRVREGAVVSSGSRRQSLSGKLRVVVDDDPGHAAIVGANVQDRAPRRDGVYFHAFDLADDPFRGAGKLCRVDATERGVGVWLVVEGSEDRVAGSESSQEGDSGESQQPCSLLGQVAHSLSEAVPNVWRMSRGPCAVPYIVDGPWAVGSMRVFGVSPKWARAEGVLSRCAHQARRAAAMISRAAPTALGSE